MVSVLEAYLLETKNDQKPVTAPLDVNKTYGNTCSFDTECGPGSVCVKRGGIEGACMKKR